MFKELIEVQPNKTSLDDEFTKLLSANSNSKLE